MSRIFSIISLSTLIILIGCDSKHIGTLRNNQINPEVKNEITKLNATVFDALKNQDEKKLLSLMSEDLKSSVLENLSPFLEKTSAIIKSKNFETVDAYHTIKETQTDAITLISGKDSDDDYIIQYQSISKESFVSILEPQRDGDRYFVTTFYALVDNQWKLNTLQFGRYTVSGMNAPELFRMAESEYKKSHLIPAINYMVIANTCMNPAEDNWQYRIASEMDGFNQSLTEEAQSVYAMPMTIDGIQTKPEIFKIMPQRVDNEICTMIKYRSDISIKDTFALAAENKAMHQMASALFPGIDEELPFIFYRAFNEIPKEEISTPYFGFVRPVESNFPTKAN